MTARFLLQDRPVSFPQFRLVSHTLCPYVQRARIVLLEKNLPHKVEYIDLNEPPAWFYDVSPLEKVPVLLVDDQPLFESIPICEYLDEISSGRMLAEDAFTRAQQRGWIEFGNVLLDQYYTMLAASEEAAYKRARATLIERLETIDEVISTGPFFSGDEFLMVDAVYAPIFRYLALLEDDYRLGLFSDLQRVPDWIANLQARPSVQQAVPDDFAAAYRVSLQRQSSMLTKK